MNTDKVTEICAGYLQDLEARWDRHYRAVLGRELVPQRLSEEAAQRAVYHLPPEAVYQHLAFMAEEIPRLMDAGRTEKAMRWLGWLQGALWGTGMQTLEEAKKRNMPEGAEYSRDA